MTQGSVLRKSARYVVLVILAFVWVTPMYVVVVSSMKSIRELFSAVFRLPEHLDLSNYVRIWNETDLLRYMLNNVFVTFAALALTTLIASLAAYAIYRARSRILASLYYLFVLGLMIPTQVAMVTIYLTMKGLGLYNSLWGLVLLYTGMSMPLSVFIFTGFFRDTPRAIFEAAVMDGAGEFATYNRIIMPLSKNVIFTVLIINGVFVWNDFMYALILIRDTALRTLQYGLYALKGEYTSEYPLIFAGVVTISVPIILLYIFFQKRFIAGMTAGAVKG